MSGKVGPGKPPVSGRIRKGEVRNPKGRPKKQREEKSGSAFEIVFDKTLIVTRDGSERRLTAEEALQLRTYKDALSGDGAAQREVLKMIAKSEKYLARHSRPKRPMVELRTEPIDPLNANAALRLLEIVSHDSDRADWSSRHEWLLLEPWAVQAALSRRKGGRRLSEQDVLDIRRCTRDADTLQWPRGTIDD